MKGHEVKKPTASHTLQRTKKVVRRSSDAARREWDDLEAQRKALESLRQIGPISSSLHGSGGADDDGFPEGPAHPMQSPESHLCYATRSATPRSRQGTATNMMRRAQTQVGSDEDDELARAVSKSLEGSSDRSGAATDSAAAKAAELDELRAVSMVQWTAAQTTRWVALTLVRPCP